MQHLRQQRMTYCSFLLNNKVIPYIVYVNSMNQISHFNGNLGVWACVQSNVGIKCRNGVVKVYDIVYCTISYHNVHYTQDDISTVE